MKGSYLTKIFGAGVILASLAVLPVAKPVHAADTNKNGFTQYQLERHSMGEHGGMMTADMDSRNACYGGNWMSAQEMYVYDRHARGEQMIVTSERTAQMMQGNNMTTPDNSASATQCMGTSTQTNMTSPAPTTVPAGAIPQNAPLPVPGTKTPGSEPGAPRDGTPGTTVPNPGGTNTSPGTR